MNLGAILRGAVKGGAAAYAGKQQGAIQASGEERRRKERDQELQIKEDNERRAERVAAQTAARDAVHLSIEQGKLKVEQANARTNANRAAKETKPSQWEEVSKRAQQYQAEGMDRATAATRARYDFGMQVLPDASDEEQKAPGGARYVPPKLPNSAVPLPGNPGRPMNGGPSNYPGATIQQAVPKKKR